MALSRKTQNRLNWGVRILLALAFAAAGSAKLAGVPMMVATFEAVGAVVLGLLCALVVWHQRPTQFRQI